MVEHGATGEDKRAVRARMRAIRATIAADGDDRARRSASICRAVIETISERAPRRVLLYDALPSEPDLAELAAWCAEQRVAVHRPAVDGDALVVVPGDLDPELLDVVVVPGLAFTREGERLGQGGGHFDRFLTRVRGDCLRIGVAFHEQLVDRLPTERHDVAVDRVITDRGPGLMST
jgi:5-formyltetrahydrofolate cyclo-ligase